MAYSSKVGSFNIDTTKTAGQTQAISGVGFTPKIVLFWWGGSTGTGDGVEGGTIRYGFGAAISNASRIGFSRYSADAAAESDAYRYSRVDEVIRILTDGTPTTEGIMDFSSMDADGFTLTVDDQFVNAYRISYLALGGDDLTNVYIGTKAMPIETGTYTTTGVGFQPDALITLGNYATVGSANFFIGMATGASNQGVVRIYSQDAQATSNTDGYGYNGEINNVNGTNDRDAFVQFDADGFTLNHLEGTTGYTFGFICLKGGQYSVGDITTRTDSNDIAETIGFQPIALLFASANRALSTQQSVTANARMSIGAGTSASERACAAISDEDNLADTETAFANYDTAVYANILDDAIVGLMDIKSIESDGFTCVMDDPDPTACWVTYLAIGATSGAVTKSLADTGLGTELSPIISASLSGIDTALGADNLNLAASLFASDVSVGADTQQLAASLGLSDVALGGDLLDLFASLNIAELAFGSEELTQSIYVITVDVGTGTDELLITSTVISGSAVWGQITGALETNIRTYANNWAGTGEISGSGDSEQICLASGQYMVSEVVQTGVNSVVLLQNEYGSGDTVLLQYRHGATEADCLSASWNTYSSTFTSLGYVQIRIESTL